MSPALFWCTLTFAGVTSNAPPALGAETVLVVTDDAGVGQPGETVRVVHRPGLAGERELAIGITDTYGRVRWTPEIGGIAVVRAGDASTRIRIEPQSLPPSSITLLILLAIAAVAAMGYGLRPRARRRR